MPTREPPDHEGRFTALFEATHRPLLAYAVRRVADPADAADVVAEAFLVAWRRIEDVPAGTDARPWMFGVARRVLANHHRGTRRRTALADRLRAEVVEAVPPPSDDDVSDVEQALARLGDEDRELLRLVAWEQLARDEIAMVLGVSRAAVRVRLHRARRRLADQLAALAAADGVPGVRRTDRAAQRTVPAGQVISGWAPARPGTEEA
ncbi:RNA polymerase sigma factor [Isoptericola sp. NPDC058082]|uniref:RNA polymerase sigma factor n=1 Tax=Isoptericola sp. NPDC058082 TaxID=3346331 RepID=UPI0036EB750A